ncbi:hypothetical protein R1sor_017869 [Riccia sorocarpa]|uniref:Uncharacterized protein n=1 Tax=Riccia sorocarpa TaxID=122646 RepID=A0ABD3IAV1_9MARC
MQTLSMGLGGSGDAPKASLIAWERITQRKADGGLGWMPLVVKARALMIKNMIKLMSDSSAEWIALARSLILRTLRSGRYQRERRQWQVQDALMLIPMTKIKGSRTLTRMGAAWNKVRKLIYWSDDGNELPEHMTLEQGMHLMTWGHPDRLTEYRKITRMLRRAKITTVQEGKDAAVNNRTWKDDGGKVGWELSTKEWTGRLGEGREFSLYLSNKWDVADSAQDWRKRWDTLWKVPMAEGLDLAATAKRLFYRHESERLG